MGLIKSTRHLVCILVENMWCPLVKRCPIASILSFNQLSFSPNWERRSHELGLCKYSCRVSSGSPLDSGVADHGCSFSFQGQGGGCRVHGILS